MDLADLKRLSSNLEPTGVGMVDELYDKHPRPYYRFLYNLARDLQPKTIVEIGVQTGVATAHMAAGAPAADIYGIDPDQVWYKKEIVENYPKVTFYQGYSESFDPQYLGDIDLLFIDGYHTYDQVKMEYEKYGKYVRPGGVIVFDDVCLPDSLEPGNRMNEFWQELPGDKKIELNFLHPEGGFGALIK